MHDTDRDGAGSAPMDQIDIPLGRIRWQERAEHRGAMAALKK
jgi:hypothetical protein